MLKLIITLVHIAALVAITIAASTEAMAQQAALPDLSISVGGNELAGGGSVASSLKIVLLLTVL